MLTSTTIGSSVVNSSLESVGALNSGTIESGFGSINTGSSDITTTGLGTFGNAIFKFKFGQNKIGTIVDPNVLDVSDGKIKVNGDLTVTGDFTITGNYNSTGDFGEINVDDIIIDNNFVGHKDNPNLIGINSTFVRIAGDINLDQNKKIKINNKTIISETTIGTLLYLLL